MSRLPTRFPDRSPDRGETYHLLQIAKVYPTPTVSPSTKLVYLTVTPWLMINGTNFNTKQTSLFFSPPLAEGQDVTITVSTFPARSGIFPLVSIESPCAFLVGCWGCQNDIASDSHVQGRAPSLVMKAGPNSILGVTRCRAAPRVLGWEQRHVSAMKPRHVLSDDVAWSQKSRCTCVGG